MSEIRDNPIPIKSRQFSSRLRKLLFIGLAAIGLLIIWWRVSRIANLKGPQYPNATLCISRTHGHEFAWAGLQDPKASHVIVPGAPEFSLHPKSAKFVDKDKGTAVQIEW